MAQKGFSANIVIRKVLTEAEGMMNQPLNSTATSITDGTSKTGRTTSATLKWTSVQNVIKAISGIPYVKLPHIFRRQSLHVDRFLTLFRN